MKIGVRFIFDSLLSESTTVVTPRCCMVINADRVCIPSPSLAVLLFLAEELENL